MDFSGIKHIAFIMDGNGRWARKRLLPRTSGHKEGLKTIESISECARRYGINVLSFFAFSTENWQRPKKEVEYLMRLLKENLPKMAEKIHKNQSRLLFSGDVSVFDGELQQIILDAQGLTQKNGPSTINICLNYGGRNDILNAVNAAVKNGKSLSQAEFANLLYTKDLPDPDLLIRTGGEMRISNFMLYQLAYTELYFCDKLWPEFSEADFLEALQNFSKRQRRFGKL